MPYGEYLHVIARVPPVVARAHPPSPLDEMALRRKRRIDKLPDESPSTLAHHWSFSRLQESPDGPVFYYNRPYTARATIPMALFHPIFGQFMDDCDSHTPTAEDNALVRALSKAMSEFYPNAEARASKFRYILAEHDIVMVSDRVPGTRYRTDGDMRWKTHCYLILGCLSEINSRGADPLLKAGWHYQEFMKTQSTASSGSRLPCLLLYLCGPMLGFAGAVYTDRPHIEILSCGLPLCWKTTIDSLTIGAARHLGALRKAIHSLEQYYKHDLPTIDALHPALRPDTSFPHQSHYLSLDDSTECRFKYVSSVPDKLVFFGKTCDGDVDICIKFVHSYSKEAHLHCASRGFAPRLRSFQSLPGQWYMVVMDVVGNEFHPFYDLRSVSPALCDHIKANIVTLHEAGFVHGDLRDVNVMARNDGKLEFMLIDFDWAGKVGEVRYPMYVNIVDIWRPDDAYDGELITVKHDMQMLDAMLPVSPS